MSRAAQELLIKCYNRATEGFAIIRGGILQYHNKALRDMAGCDMVARLAEEVFPCEVLNLAENSHTDINGALFFGKPVDIRAFASDGITAVVVSDMEAQSEELRQNREALIALNDMYDRMADAITQVYSSAELMVRLGSDRLSPEMRDLLINVGRAAENMCSIMDDITETTYTISQNRSKGCINGDLSACINNVAEKTRRHFDAAGAGLAADEVSKHITFPFNPTSMEHMVYRLLSHEFKKVSPGDTVRIYAKETDGGAEIVVADNSVPESEEHLAFLREPSLENVGKIIENYGSDLYLVRRIAVFFDGTLTAERTASENRLIVTLPRQQIKPHIQEPIPPISLHRSMKHIF